MARQKEFDPLEYIESAFLDAEGKAKKQTIVDREIDETGPKVKFKKTALSAPRPRRTSSRSNGSAIDPELAGLLETLPKNIRFLSQFFGDDVTSKYYTKEFKESRGDFIHRLLDPVLSLEDVSRLLGVCPATVRRYTNRGWLGHFRTSGGQRRFRLSHVVKFVDEHGRHPEENA
jgi:hypothetical protein